MRRVLYCLGLLFLCGIAFSKTIHVPDDKATIQAAIDSAAVGDTVLVHPNTYLENINFNGKNIVVGSLFLTTGDTSYVSQTVIDGYDGTVVTFENSEDSTAVLCGFTLIKTRIYGFLGNGIVCRGTGPRLMNLKIQGIFNGDWDSPGGGILCESNAYPKLTDLTIVGNSSNLGGGIYCIDSDLTLENVSIINNSAYGLAEDIYVTNGLGGGLYCESSNVIMKHVVLKENNAQLGGGIHLWNTDLKMENVVITRNSAVYARGSIGGGIYCSGSNPSLANVTISHNYADNGGGIYCSDSDLNFSFENRCNIYWNHAIFGNEIYIGGEKMISVVVDTFIVFNPTDTHIYPLNQCTYNFLNAKATPAAADLYVSPLGDDSNSGLIPSEPLQSIRMAIEKVIADSLNPRTIFLGQGQYSSSTTGEAFPIKMKNHLTLCGDSTVQVTINAELNNSVFYFNGICQSKIRHVTITGGSNRFGGGIYCDQSSLSLENVCLWQNRAYTIELPPPDEFGFGAGGGIYCINSQLYIQDGIIDDNGGDRWGGGIGCYNSILDLQNISFCKNNAQYGGGVYINASSSVWFDNVLISENSSSEGGGIACMGGNMNLQNLVISGNEAESGGGIYLSSDYNLEDVIITRNEARNGGGIYSNGFLTLTNCTISWNKANRGGGIHFSNQGIDFNKDNRCNIYCNHAYESGGDLYTSSQSVAVDVVVDTFTVLNPSEIHATPIDNYTFDIQFAKIDPVSCDLYVNPDGNNENSGTSFSEPLKTISYALGKIESDSLNSHAIYLAEGIYSNTTNGEIFPLPVKSYVSLYGETENNVILDAENESGVIASYAVVGCTLKNLMVINGYSSEGGGIYCDNSDIKLEEITLVGNEASFQGGGICGKNSDLDLTGVTINENISGVYGGGVCFWFSILNFSDVTISDNISGEGGGISLISDTHANMSNVKISDNRADRSGGGISFSYSVARLENIIISGNSADLGGAIYCYHSDPVLINATLSENVANYGSTIKCISGSSPILVNSIVWNNTNQDINILSEWAGNNTITIAYSDVEGGLDSLVTSDEDTIYWFEGNIDTNPLFLNPDSGDFSLQEGSPCIDAGTAFFVWQGDTIINLSESEYNGEVPDMGAFESEYTGMPRERIEIPKKYSLSQNYPNPFNPETIIQFDLPKQSHVKIEIYNLLGQKVIGLVDENKTAGSYSVEWKGLDRFENRLPSGTYLLRMDCGEFSKVRKIILMK